MKKIIALFTALILLPIAANAAGTLTFQTDDGLFNEPFVFQSDTTTKLDSTFVGQIWAGTTSGSLAAAGDPVQFGLFNGSPNPAVNGLILNGTEVTVAGTTAGGSGFYSIYAWEGTISSTYAGAPVNKRGISAEVAVTFGGDTGAGSIPAPNVSGFSSFSLVPEPTSMTLAILGLGGLIAARRRKSA